jgi:hypothetical protein
MTILLADMSQTISTGIKQYSVCLQRQQTQEDQVEHNKQLPVKF